MSKWRDLQDWLYDNGLVNGDFTQAEYRDDSGLSGEEATAHIQAYLEAQRDRPRRRHEQTAYILRRLPGTRTSVAVWHVGVRARDAREVGKGVGNDIRRTIRRAFIPDLAHLAEVNPRAARSVEVQTGPLLDAAVTVIEQALLGVIPPPDE
jgi:hypothetical protein